MKTSDKLLIGAFIYIFALMIFGAVALKSTVNNEKAYMDVPARILSDDTND